MSSMRTFSGPCSRASRSAASRSAARVACFFRSRRPATATAWQGACGHANLRARIFLPTVAAMRARGMTYDTGFVRDGHNSRERFDPQTVERELTIIRDDLHCNAVQLIGGDPDRLELAARAAAGLGLEVWFSPYPLELTVDAIRALLLDCAERAERLRTAGAAIVLVAGVELSVMNRGFLEGADVGARVAGLLADPDARPARITELQGRLGAFFRATVPALRIRFHGRITYAAIQFEGIDWDLFDIVTYELI